MCLQDDQMSSSLHSWLRKSTCLEGSCLTAVSSATVGVGRGDSDIVVSVVDDSTGSSHVRVSVLVEDGGMLKLLS